MGKVARLFLTLVGYRGSALLFFGLLDVVYAYSLFFPPADAALTPALIFLASIAPLGVYAMLWLIAAGFCIVNALRVNDWSGFAAAITIKVLWGLLYVMAAVEGVPRAYVSVTIWLVLAGFVAIISRWPEPTNVQQLEGINQRGVGGEQEREDEERDIDRRWP